MHVWERMGAFQGRKISKLKQDELEVTAGLLVWNLEAWHWGLGRAEDSVDMQIDTDIVIGGTE